MIICWWPVPWRHQCREFDKLRVFAAVLHVIDILHEQINKNMCFILFCFPYDNSLLYIIIVLSNWSMKFDSFFSSFFFLHISLSITISHAKYLSKSANLYIFIKQIFYLFFWIKQLFFHEWPMMRAKMIVKKANEFLLWKLNRFWYIVWRNELIERFSLTILWNECIYVDQLNWLFAWNKCNYEKRVGLTDIHT